MGLASSFAFCNDGCGICRGLRELHRRILYSANKHTAWGWARVIDVLVTGVGRLSACMSLLDEVVDEFTGLWLASG